MNTLTTEELACCRQLVAWALEEDLGTAGDVTSLATIPADAQGRGVLIGRADGVLAGLPVVREVVARLDPRLQLQLEATDGQRVGPGTRLAVLAGLQRSLLAAERTALNFLQRLSGVATQTRRYVDAVAGLPVQILDTRKTTPGWRLLEKYAVRCGGGHNHRIGLFDAVLIKDNHLWALGGEPAAVGKAVRAARDQVGRSVIVEVEVETFEQLDAALAEKPDIVLLDNMSLEMMREADRRRRAAAPEVQLEASGGITLQTVRAIAETGVDRISVGALTHSAPALDMALDYEKS